ncbi:methionyl-tRNA formyltransferase [Planctomycetes bacterium K23_9]|uniref:Methionyl-tRNA formyltransferase n=1 Tax=Stieleria marina TaxID=1930275 RepID=A0A517NVD0_9BACT|nr:Methionyl-tRNA formyltransferase [Planctomycetes bacterium K23_9]
MTNQTMRLILMGTGPFAVPSFEALRTAGHDIALVVTKPLPAVKSRKGPPPSPVRQWALDHDLPVYDPLSINEEAAIDRTTKIEADLLVVCDYGQILKPAALGAARLGGINLHGSLLPQYRGAAPVQRSLLSGDAVTGVSVIHMTPRLDGGPILCTRSTPISDDETAGELEDRLSAIGVDATLEAIDALTTWDGASPIGEKQNAELITKAPRLSKAEAEIDWSRTSRQVDCHVRGMQPWPVAFTHIAVHADKPPIRLAITKIATKVELDAVSELSDDVLSPDKAEPGMIVSAKKGLFVATGDGTIEIKRLKPAGKKEMDAMEFVRGHHLKTEMRFICR